MLGSKWETLERELLTEDQILSNREMKDSIKLSVLCLTYNHQEFIEQAIKSFLFQKVDFLYELIIHDDCSTDGTREIIEHYHKLYPNIIRPIFQNRNQYSQGINPLFRYCFPLARGEYVALCEGDDFWISSEKLKKQVEILEKNKNISLVFHSAIEFDCLSKGSRLICKALEADGFVSFNECIRGRGSYMPTASLVFRRDSLLEGLEWFERPLIVWDIFIQAYLAFSGDVYFINEPMSVYRRNVPGSWTYNEKKDKPFFYHCNEMKRLVLEFEQFLKNRPKSYMLSYPYFEYFAASVLLNFKHSFVKNKLSFIFKGLPFSKVSLLFSLCFMKLVALAVLRKVKKVLI